MTSPAVAQGPNGISELLPCDSGYIYATPLHFAHLGRDYQVSVRRLRLEVVALVSGDMGRIDVGLIGGSRFSFPIQVLSGAVEQNMVHV